jgi:hypothetical protein
MLTWSVITATALALGALVTALLNSV